MIAPSPQNNNLDNQKTTTRFQHTANTHKTTHTQQQWQHAHVFELSHTRQARHNESCDDEASRACSKHISCTIIRYYTLITTRDHFIGKPSMSLSWCPLLASQKNIYIYNNLFPCYSEKISVGKNNNTVAKHRLRVLLGYPIKTGSLATAPHIYLSFVVCCREHFCASNFLKIRGVLQMGFNF